MDTAILTELGIAEFSALFALKAAFTEREVDYCQIPESCVSVCYFNEKIHEYFDQREVEYTEVTTERNFEIESFLTTNIQT